MEVLNDLLGSPRTKKREEKESLEEKESNGRSDKKPAANDSEMIETLYLVTLANEGQGLQEHSKGGQIQAMAHCRNVDIAVAVAADCVAMSALHKCLHVPHQRRYQPRRAKTELSLRGLRAAVQLRPRRNPAQDIKPAVLLKYLKKMMILMIPSIRVR